MAFKFPFSKKTLNTTLLLAALTLITSACSTTRSTSVQNKKPSVSHYPKATPVLKIKKKTVRVRPRINQPRHNPFGNRLSSAAKERTRHQIVYDGSYYKLGYPWGDVPANIGVCTDVVIRSYRRLGIDLQQQVHRDMSNNFNAYPNLSKWELKGPDANIDHRRVYNLRAFFKRHGQSLPPSYNPTHFRPGDVVSWQLAPGQEHIGIVVNQRSKQDPRRFLVVHNIAEGPKMEDILFRFRISGHYRYTGKMKYYQPTQYARANIPSRSVSIPGVGTIPPELLR